MIDQREPAFARAIEVIRKNFGSLGDLQPEVAQVVWITSFRASETTLEIEKSDGTNALVKDMLVGERKKLPDLEEHLIKFDFLKRMVQIIRDQPDVHLQKSDAQILIDCLKWNIIDAADLSTSQRDMVRKSAEADPAYLTPVPNEVLS